MRVAESALADENNLTTLVRRFELPLLQYATRILGDRDRARDVVQETFVELQRSRRRQTDVAPAKWLFTVCRNRALNICRKEKRMTYLDEEILEKQPGEEPAPNEGIEREEASGFLLRIGLDPAAEYETECASHPRPQANVIPLVQEDPPWSLSRRWLSRRRLRSSLSSAWW